MGDSYIDYTGDNIVDTMDTMKKLGQILFYISGAYLIYELFYGTRRNKKGQISIGWAITTGLGLLLGAFGYAMSNSNRVGVVETRTAVLESQYQEFSKKLDRVLEIVDTKSSYSASSTISNIKSNGKN